jgi:hypothetical protein
LIAELNFACGTCGLKGNLDKAFDFVHMPILC